jgi:hypothetical protein
MALNKLKLDKAPITPALLFENFFHLLVYTILAILLGTILLVISNYTTAFILIFVFGKTIVYTIIDSVTIKFLYNATVLDFANIIISSYLTYQLLSKLRPTIRHFSSYWYILVLLILLVAIHFIST